MKCKICGNQDNNNIFSIKEMMYGSGDSFDYVECNNCGCLQIVEFPEGMEQYYPSDDYYSFKKTNYNILNSFFKRKRDKYALLRKDFIGMILNKMDPIEFFMTLGTLEIDTDWRILDVGCGSGWLINSLNEVGFTDLTGIDPFLNEEIANRNVNLHKMSIHDLPDDSLFDLIIFRHSFEHLPDQLESLKQASALLSEDGFIIIDMPVKNDYIWELYSTNWVQIDAPRHFFIQTLKSMEILVKKSNLCIEKIIFSTSEYLFWGSELYNRGIPLLDGKSKLDQIFTNKDFREFKRKTENLNRKNLGDQATFILRKIN